MRQTIPIQRLQAGDVLVVPRRPTLAAGWSGEDIKRVQFIEARAKDLSVEFEDGDSREYSRSALVQVVRRDVAA